MKDVEETRLLLINGIADEALSRLLLYDEDETVLSRLLLNDVEDTELSLLLLYGADAALLNDAVDPMLSRLLDDVDPVECLLLASAVAPGFRSTTLGFLCLMRP